MAEPRSLEHLIEILHTIFESDSIDVDHVQKIMESYISNKDDWQRYAKFEKARYTRNLVDEGNGKFNLLILCWGEGQGSSIHDHADAHCFMKMLQGQLKETQFDWPDKNSPGDMRQRSERFLIENSVAYINDSIGLHRVENDSHTEPAISLHLYSPPFQFCQTFDQRTGVRSSAKMTFYSKFGEIVPPEAPNPQENN
ncbi:cysteine dioxygenase type 1 [Aulostomus maculatus]